MASLCSPLAVKLQPRPAFDAGAGAGVEFLRDWLTSLAGRIAVVSSFGAQSAVLLAYVAEIAPATPVLFLDTGTLFTETLQYRQDLTAHLGLLDVRDLRPPMAAVQADDPCGLLHRSDADACCALRKVAPLERALAPFAAWVNGRRRTQSTTRVAMPLVETVAGRTKINPLAQWSDAQIEAEMVRRRLPRHKLVARGYPSIGCRPCTRPVAAGEDPRSGRWVGTAKTECGIHGQFPAVPAVRRVNG
jgi:phosphoadenosine phosphosulfate reductase